MLVLVQNLQLSGVDLCPGQEARSWVLTVVPDGPVLGAVEVGVLEETVRHSQDQEDGKSE